MEAEAGDTEPDSPARQVLLKQGRLIDAQRRSENFGAALKVLTGVAGLAVVLSLGWMMWRAAHADGVVIRAFETPPALAAEGVQLRGH